MRKFPLLMGLFFVLILLAFINSFNMRSPGFVTGMPLDKSSILTPFVYEDNITAVNEAYSTTSNCPWGFVHMGIDFFAVNGSPFQAVANGQIVSKEKFFNTGNGYWQVNVQLAYNSSVSFTYGFEPDGQEADADVQMSMIPHQIGDSLNQADVLGGLLALDEYAHIHWEIVIGTEKVCPDPYFTPAARQSVLNVIHQTNSTWEMCYCGTDPCPTGNIEQTPGFTHILLLVTFSSLFVLRKKNYSKAQKNQRRSGN